MPRHDYRVITVEQTGETFPVGSWVVDYWPFPRLVAWWPAYALAHLHRVELQKYDRDFDAEIECAALRMELESEPELLRQFITVKYD